MERISQLLLGILMLAATAWGHSAPLGSPTQPVVNVGRIERLENFPSRFVEARPIDVWLPSDYSPMKRYAVISMQDGAGLFDAGPAWNRQAWKVHGPGTQGRAGGLHSLAAAMLNLPRDHVGIPLQLHLQIKTEFQSFEKGRQIRHCKRA